MVTIHVAPGSLPLGTILTVQQMPGPLAPPPAPPGPGPLRPVSPVFKVDGTAEPTRPLELTIGFEPLPGLYSRKLAGHWSRADVELLVSRHLVNGVSE